MRTRLSLVLTLALTGCIAGVGDLDGFTESTDACDPRGSSFTGQDLELQFLNTNAHIDNTMFAAIQVGEERSVEAVIILSGFDDPNLRVVIPEAMPGPSANFAFWMDTDFDGVFDPLTTAPPDHQWLRPICPDGTMTFTHTTPFQSVLGATSVGAVFHFMIPTEIGSNHDLFNTFHMSARATRIEGDRRQTRAYFRWSPYVGRSAAGTPRVRLAPARSCDPAVPTDCDGFSGDGAHCAEVTPVTMPATFQCVSDGARIQSSVREFQMGGNALGELRGPIDTGAEYEIEFIIDADCPAGSCEDGDPEYELGSAGDFVCMYRATAPSAGDEAVNWHFMPTLAACDYPAGFDPATF